MCNVFKKTTTINVHQTTEIIQFNNTNIIAMQRQLCIPDKVLIVSDTQSMVKRPGGTLHKVFFIQQVLLLQNVNLG